MKNGTEKSRIRKDLSARRRQTHPDQKAAAAGRGKCSAGRPRVQSPVRRRRARRAQPRDRNPPGRQEQHHGRKSLTSHSHRLDSYGGHCRRRHRRLRGHRHVQARRLQRVHRIAGRTGSADGSNSQDACRRNHRRLALPSWVRLQRRDAGHDHDRGRVRAGPPVLQGRGLRNL